MSEIPIDLTKTAYTRGGTSLRLQPHAGVPGALHLKTIDDAVVARKEHPCWAQDILLIVSTSAGKLVPLTTNGFSWGCELQSAAGNGRLSFGDGETIHLEWHGEPLTFLPFQSVPLVLDAGPAQKVLLLREAVRFLRVNASEDFGRLTPTPELSQLLDPPPVLVLVPDAASGTQRVDFHFEPSELPAKPAPEAMDLVVAREKARVATWMDRRMPVPTDLEPAADFAWLTLDNVRVNPNGLITRPLLLSGKNTWLTKAWSWDNCFAALAVAPADLDLAWQQMLVFFDHQTPDGQLPNSLGSGQAYRTWVKPPIYGWTILRLIERFGLEANRPYYDRIYEPLARLYHFWNTIRDPSGSGMSGYYDGNDSGWDNATAFDHGSPTYGVDLAAYLVIDTQVLALLARELGKTTEADRWDEESAGRRDTLLTRYVHNDRFYSPPQDPTNPGTYQCLLNTMPVILGKQLPDPIAKNLIKALGTEGELLTPYGLASESLTSAEFREDGYWRGAVWAPVNYMIVLGLLDMGEKTLALKITQRFCDMVRKDPWMSENYSALDGHGLQSPTVTWTAAVFVLFADLLNTKSQ